MQIITSPQQLQSLCQKLRQAGRTIGFVPTMGYLHEGHLTLVDEAKRRADVVVVSIFVNPKQFGPREDLARYPRNLQNDTAQCQSRGVDVLFVPAVDDMYPSGFQSLVDVPALSEHLCGDRRPGHFRGVCTVVAKLFVLVGPCTAVFGQKDYQQLQIIRRMVLDLGFAVDVVAGATVRQTDGVALSSRNSYLSAEERVDAPQLYLTLCGMRDLWEKNGGRTPAAALVQWGGDRLKQFCRINVDYLAVKDPQTLVDVDGPVPSGAVICIAAWIGTTRLIDNLIL